MDSLQAAVEVAKVAMEKGELSSVRPATNIEDAEKLGQIVAAFITTVYEKLEAEFSPKSSAKPPFKVPQMIVEDTEPESTADPE